MSMGLNTIVYSTLAGLSTILGVFLVTRNEKVVLQYSHYVNSLAAGLLLGIAFFQLFPESMELTSQTFLFIFAGFLIFYLLESGIVIHSGSEIHFDKKNMHQHNKGVVMFSGLFFHSFIDGIIIGVSFEVGPKLGLLTSLGVILHELPEGVTTFSLLLNSLKRSTALKMSLAVALATPLGAFICLAFVGNMSAATLGNLLAFTGGSLLYIAAADLIPETHGTQGFQNAGFLLMGVLLLFFLSNVE